MIVMKILITSYIIPILFIPIYFNKLIPTLFDLNGPTFAIKEELNISYFYLPVLGLLLSIICLKIYSIFSEFFLKIILISIFIIITIKLEIPSIIIMLYSNYKNNILLIDKINNFTSSLFGLSIITIFAGLYLFIRKMKNRPEGRLI